MAQDPWAVHARSLYGKKKKPARRKEPSEADMLSWLIDALNAPGDQLREAEFRRKYDDALSIPGDRLREASFSPWIEQRNLSAKPRY